MENNINISKAVNSRQKAEEVAKRRFSLEDMVPSVSKMMKLLHELEVHQIELEMQSEELVRAKERLEASAKKYSELYNYALPCYFSLSEEGKIVELNVSGAKMLGK